MPTYRFRRFDDVNGIDAAAWDALTDGQACLSHAFLAALEATGCVGAGSGWLPRHATLWEGPQLVAAMPLYEKHHSYGEYVFDWAWAEAYARHGLAYYPKWLAAVPFTPVPGMRLLGRDITSRKALLQATLALAEKSGLSSLHVLFPTETEAGWMREAGLLIRQGVQFHWFNAGYRDFDGFLASLNHEKRKKIRQDRRHAAAHALTFRWLDGTTANAADWAFFHRCYAATYALHRSTPYLGARFFTQLASRAPHSVRLLLAERQDEPVASAFFLCDGEALYGRYWGATEHLPFLHFELCYYRAIDYCIDHRLSRFEGGAQGEHKLARGLQPVVTRSAHWIREPRWRDAVDRFLAQETAGIDFYLDELTERSPFRALQGTAPE
ncbi:GNAT family N-acetyltransferase [Aromatoleum anaerobium]|uniref:GNAT family N-acetyltransferase n=1 Tax=Aromatoleum anaerobium TaxID=182180 RepID=A0ABX1PIH2_9RHOO|nr:GNAT family N-acetyltransferase [Aromatoleum anaerobium]MCK0508400.1 GNAT family N-acetyltransferase [Aromatoleum anaerobium]